MKSNSSNSESWLKTKSNPKHPPPSHALHMTEVPEHVWDFEHIHTKIRVGHAYQIQNNSSHNCQ